MADETRARLAGQLTTVLDEMHAAIRTRFTRRASAALSQGESPRHDSRLRGAPSRTAIRVAAMPDPARTEGSD